ncbi:MAG: amino acid permease [Acidimicrobiales bacterium]
MSDPDHGPSAADRLERDGGRDEAPGAKVGGTDPLAGQPARSAPVSPRGKGPGSGPLAPSSVTPPAAIPVDSGAAYPESFRYRLKNKLLGPPLVSEQLKHERLGRPTALGVLAPDCISSSAYGTEEMLTQLVPYVGLAAFTLVVPVTLAILGVLFFVTLSYLDVIQLYTKAGGSYVVARDNFGPKVAQIAAVALLIDYTVTVAVQTSAGTAALTSAVPSLVPWTVPITVGVVLLLLLGNLRGIREAGKYFAIPTYFFVLSLGGVIVAGYIEAALGDLHPRRIPPHDLIFGHHFGTPGSGLLMGLAFISLLRSFANGGSSLTGLEAISNGVSAFRRPEARNARVTLVAMSSVLAFLVFGVTMLARWTHAVPYAAGSPTVLSQEVVAVAGHGPVFYIVQIATLLILYTGGNTSFNGFPYLASFVAGDQFLPRQLTRRGHRLAFSSGIIVLTVLSLALILAFRANVDTLVALYAIGVFTGFAMAGSGLFKHHLTHKGHHWRRKVVVNGFAAVLTASVVLIFAVAKFFEGAWIVVLVGPLMYWGLIRMHRQYVREGEELEVSAAEATEAPLLRRHTVIVLVDSLDMATVRAIQYARTLAPDELRAVHFDIDSAATRELEQEWSRLGGSRLPLDIVEVPDRRLGRAALELAAETVADGDTECTVLLPRRGFEWGWQRLLHDRTADKIAGVVSQVPHVSATIVPYNLRASSARAESRTGFAQRVAERAASRAARAARGARSAEAAGAAGSAEAGGSGPGAGGTRPAPEQKGARAGVVQPAETVAQLAEPVAQPAETVAQLATRGGGQTAETGAPRPEAPRGAAARPARGAATRPVPEEGRDERARDTQLTEADRALARRATNAVPIGEVEWRQRVRVAGRVKSVRVQPRGGTPNLEATLADRTGGILLVFQGRPKIPGIVPGARLVAEGMVGAWGRRLAILNPDYELVGEREEEDRAGVTEDR